MVPWLHWWRTNVDVRVLLDPEGQSRGRVSVAPQQPTPKWKLKAISKALGRLQQK